MTTAHDANNIRSKQKKKSSETVKRTAHCTFTTRARLVIVCIHFHLNLTFIQMAKKEAMLSTLPISVSACETSSWGCRDNHAGRIYLFGPIPLAHLHPSYYEFLSFAKASPSPTEPSAAPCSSWTDSLCLLGESERRGRLSFSCSTSFSSTS